MGRGLKPTSRAACWGPALIQLYFHDAVELRLQHHGSCVSDEATEINGNDLARRVKVVVIQPGGNYESTTSPWCIARLERSTSIGRLGSCTEENRLVSNSGLTVISLPTMFAR